MDFTQVGAISGCIQLAAIQKFQLGWIPTYKSSIHRNFWFFKFNRVPIQVIQTGSGCDPKYGQVTLKLQPKFFFAEIGSKSTSRIRKRVSSIDLQHTVKLPNHRNRWLDNNDSLPLTSLRLGLLTWQMNRKIARILYTFRKNGGMEV